MDKEQLKQLHKKEYDSAYHKRPEVKERIKKYNKTFILKTKKKCLEQAT